MIGRGGSGTVTREGDFAIKKQMLFSGCDEDDTYYNISSSALREANMLQTLDHPNIIKAVSIKRHEMDLIIEMPLGWTSMSYRDINKVIIGCLSAFIYMHDNGIIYGDIKPQNMVLHDATDEVKIIDFGSCRFTEAYENITTKFYEAPEVRAHLLSGKVSDVWSLGISIMQLIVNKTTNIFDSVDKDKPTIDDVLRYLQKHHSSDSLLKGMLTVDPKDRWTMRECYHYMTGQQPSVVLIESPVVKVPRLMHGHNRIQNIIMLMDLYKAFSLPHSEVYRAIVMHDDFYLNVRGPYLQDKSSDAIVGAIFNATTLLYGSKLECVCTNNIIDAMPGVSMDDILDAYMLLLDTLKFSFSGESVPQDIDLLHSTLKKLLPQDTIDYFNL